MRLPSMLLSLCVVAGFAGAAMADEYKLDPDHCDALFRAGHLGISHIYGSFADISGTMSLDDSDPTKDTFEVIIQAASLSTHQQKRDQHLAGPDFFDAKQFPTLSFRSTSVKAIDAKTLEVSGDLTIHGVTKPITVQVVQVGAGKDPWGNYRAGYETQFMIKRSDYGMNFMPQAVADEVQITVAVEGIRK